MSRCLSLLVAASATFTMLSMPAPAAPAPAADAAVPDARLAIARDVVALSGAGDLARRMLAQGKPFFVAQARSTGAMSDADAERLWLLFVEEYDARIPEFLDNVARTYADVLDEAQLSEWRAFLTTGTGRALSAHQLEFAVAGQQAGSAIGAAAEMRARQRLQEEKARAPAP
jgi:hypothetical protein